MPAPRCCSNAAAWCAEPSLEFFHLSDTHISNPVGVHSQIKPTLDAKRDSSAHLTAALDRLARVSAGFIVITGDLIEGFRFAGAEGQAIGGQIEAFVKLIDGSRVPIYPALGNHDLTGYRPGPGKPVADQRVAGESRKRWSELVPSFREGTYYAFTKQVGQTAFRFLMLDDGEAVGLDPAFAAAQAAWLKRQVTEHPRDVVVLALHIPLGTAPYGQELRAAIAGARNVALVLAGHRHNDGFEDVDLGTRTLPQVRTAALFLSDANCRRIRLYQDRIEISATGRPEEIVRVVRVERAAVAGR